MKIKLDENLSRHLKNDLAKLGHDVLTALDENLLGKSDVELRQAAQKEERMIFTLDVEFANLGKFPPGSHPGVVLLRPRSLGPQMVNRFVLQFVKRTKLEEISRCVVVVDPNRVRVRRPPPEGGSSQEGDFS